MNILGLFAHPDDFELWAGGTALLHLALHDDVRLRLYFQLTPERLTEHSAAMAVMGITSSLHPVPEYSVIPDGAAIEEEGIVPDVILTHWEHDTHVEHRAAFECAVRVAHHLWRKRRHRTTLLMTTTYFGRGSIPFNPDLLIDITSHAIRKRAAVMCHASQKPERLLRDVESQTALYGSRIGVAHAEGFKEYPLFGMTATAARSSFHDFIAYNG